MSQLLVYSSGDASGPGVMSGTAGSLLTVLDAILVTGYLPNGPAGWAKPFANSGNIGCYKNASPANGGNGFGLVINDNGPNVTSTYKEAWATGWESVAGVGSPVGSGSGQFPTPAQLLTTGHVVVRKSATADAAGRAWICFADSLTFYLFIASGDTAGVYMALWFGDFFSLGGSGDAYRCMLFGNPAENSAGLSAIGGPYDCLGTLSSTLANIKNYCPRTFGGGGSSIAIFLTGAISLGAGATSTPVANIGVLQVPNGTDNAYYLPPVFVVDAAAKQLRGRLRGMFHSAHPLATFADGQVISGAGDYAGKTLQVVSRSVNLGLWVLETSNTVETN